MRKAEVSPSQAHEAPITDADPADRWAPGPVPPGTGGPTGATLRERPEGLSLHCVPEWVPSHCGRPGGPQPSCSSSSPSVPALWGALVWARQPLSPQTALDLTWPHHLPAFRCPQAPL